MLLQLVLLGVVGVSSGDLINIAPNGTSAASSVGWSGTALKAVDGNTNGRYSGGSCYHSQTSGQNTLSVILEGGEIGVLYPVSTVKVYNRIDRCCDERIDGAMVYVDDHQCGQIHFDVATTVYELDCEGYEGSEVRVLQTNNYLQICEIEIFVEEADMPIIPGYTNVALGRTTAQSSVGWSGVASRAVDGDSNKWWGGSSCTHTRWQRGNWWTVELDNEEYVQSVVIHNRIDNCCKNRIDGAKVWIESGGEYQLCGTISYNDASTAVIVVECAGYGDKIKVTQDNSYLTLCEVQVLALSEAPSEAIEE